MDNVTARTNADALTKRSLAQTKTGESPPRTDVGTITLHWATALAFVVSLVTGIRIAADALRAPFSKWLAPVLPQGEIFSWHFLAGLAVFFCGTAYVAYLARSGLVERNSPKKTRILAMRAPARLKWGAVNIILHRFVYALVIFLTGTGVMMYLGYGGWLAYLHSTAAFVALVYIFAHVVAHFLYAGWQQIFRVFRPAPLAITKAVRPRPLLVAAAIGVAVACGVAGLDWATRDTLVVARVSDAPKLDGAMGDPAWSRARPVFIRTQQGANLGGSGESLVEVRALHDGQKIYFAFRWEDPTRSLRRIPIIKKEDGWHVLDERAGLQDAVDFYEDKLAVIFSDNPSLGGAGATDLGANPLPGKPMPINGRGFHYTTDASYIDMWQWKASRGACSGVSTANISARPTPRPWTSKITMPATKAAIGTSLVALFIRITSSSSTGTTRGPSRFCGFPRIGRRRSQPSANSILIPTAATTRTAASTCSTGRANPTLQRPTRGFPLARSCPA
ncbi:hypothetical protein NK6_2229 [Bradyrhizobium diazoefficiens]|uniref:Cytochrome c-552/DMSO reductase-like haem-binding domain-containing protein n=1 Tax=Bradyrhizobium diazoefficiens TaxID=1355477 RepID=A0A0E3VTC3_9BRAD|nr:hypothetical protein NK6_2229 [Bradyrhizobium diazoefficiens]